jgi:hypothetical protein
MRSLGAMHVPEEIMCVYACMYVCVLHGTQKGRMVRLGAMHVPEEIMCVVCMYVCVCIAWYIEEEEGATSHG